jgi:predicted O-linked N-acetylglucosamine transferase (SPINDLY family)
MAQNYRIQHFREEHENFLRLADTIEKVLELAGKNIFAQHLKALKGRRSLDRGLSSIEKHCHIGGPKIDSIYQNTLQLEERERIASEHERILEAIVSFREELKCATADRTMAMILPGMDVVKRLRTHIAYERELLARVAPSSKRVVTITEKRKKSARSVRTRTKHTRQQGKTPRVSYLPYTLEPHPEL